MNRPVEVTHRAATRLAAAGLPSPGADARHLVAHAMGMEVSRMLMADEVTEAQLVELEAILRRRLAGEPVQHIVGRAAFRYTEVAVGPGVFIPRPETELLVDLALQLLARRPAGRRRVVELCAGSGAITRSLATELGGLELHAIELSPRAHAYLETNLEGLGVDIRLGDMADAFGDLDAAVDLVVVNPPYVPDVLRGSLPLDVSHDPEEALFSGADGLDALRVVSGVARRLLVPGGWLLSEHDETQRDAVLDLFTEAGFVDVTDVDDLTSRPRYVRARQPDVAGLPRE